MKIAILVFLVAYIACQPLTVCLADEFDVKARLSGTYSKRNLQPMAPTNICGNSAATSCCNAGQYDAINNWTQTAQTGAYTLNDTSRFRALAQALADMGSVSSRNLAKSKERKLQALAKPGINSNWKDASICKGKLTNGFPVAEKRRMQPVLQPCGEANRLISEIANFNAEKNDWTGSDSACANDVNAAIKGYFCKACNKNNAKNYVKENDTRTTFVSHKSAARLLDVACGAHLRNSATTLINLLLRWEDMVPKSRRLQPSVQTSDSALQTELLGYDYKSCADEISSKGRRRLQPMVPSDVVQKYASCRTLAQKFMNDFVCNWSLNNRYTAALKSRIQAVVTKFGNMAMVTKVNKLLEDPQDNRRLQPIKVTKQECDIKAGDWTLGLELF